ncbi:MarR family winged helix-turn-helix transcriptional regulator [Lacticaseibacillus brantae]|uniref:HTH marR-type domain-containing protein n=1 Tax=Lacticaseibacillus brantae DSM 23927 TaxID=1423727 RepID=A0A0R2B946_9LACO|nr:MarR family transcriptional regulator [Lacticaseibacillus brantae]KRM72099.1 hypothetical protein FC34_GL001083 [Lacticaseibacillus brantae DSM 23927]
MAEFNVTRSQAQTLGYLEENPGANQRQIAEHFSHREASVSTLLRNLEKAGYIEKHVSSGTQDRSKKVYLTSNGQHVAQQLRQRFNTTNHQSIGGLSEREIDELITLLTKIHDHQNN